MIAAWGALAGAIVAEVAGTLALRQVARTPAWWSWLIVIAGYTTAFALLMLALRRLPVSSTYATWGAVGTTATALGGVALFGEQLTAPAVLGIALIVVGVLLVSLGGAHG